MITKNAKKIYISIALMAIVFNVYAVPEFHNTSHGRALSSLQGINTASTGREADAPAVSGIDKIVGGIEAGNGEFPFMVSLQVRGEHFCGGSLIKKNWVLTANHCINGFVKGDSVIIGANDLTQITEAEIFTAAEIIRHPESPVSNPVDYDFALIRLDGESKFPPIPLNHSELGGDIELVYAGWGRTSGTATHNENLLRKVTVPLVSSSTCSRIWQSQRKITDRMICTGFHDSDKGACNGDSGGPLLMGAGADRTLVGVVSWGSDGCTGHWAFGVASKVSSVIEWIESTTR
jgi:trypsin